MKAIIIATAAVGLAVLGATQRPASDTSPKLTLGKPVQVGAIAIVPILADRVMTKDKYITLAQATKMDAVEIIEKPGGDVNNLVVRNKASLPLLLFAGELLLGGKQDRIVGRDSIVPPKSELNVPVFCVEHGRWSGNDGRFRGGDTFVPDNVRATAANTGSQQGVWDEVSKAHEAKGGQAPSTQTIQGVTSDPAVRKNVEVNVTKLMKGIDNSPKVVGMICWLNGKVHSADIFSSREMFDGSKEKLIRSYAFDLALVKAPQAKAVNITACQVFLKDIANARREMAEKGIGGTVCKIKDGKIVGYESGSGGFGGGAGGNGFNHGSYKSGGG